MCVNGKNRDNNYNEVIDKVFDCFETEIKALKELIIEKDKEIKKRKTNWIYSYKHRQYKLLKERAMTKKEQLRWVKDKGLITKEEKDFLNWLQLQNENCFCCGKQRGIEWHHIKERTQDKKVHTELIPLCGVECHRLGKYSVHGNSNWFRDNFPIEEQREYAKGIYEIYLSERGE